MRRPPQRLILLALESAVRKCRLDQVRLENAAAASLAARLETARAAGAQALAVIQAAPGFEERHDECRSQHRLRCAGWRPLSLGGWRAPDRTTAPDLAHAIGVLDHVPGSRHRAERRNRSAHQ